MNRCTSRMDCALIRNNRLCILEVCELGKGKKVFDLVVVQTCPPHDRRMQRGTQGGGVNGNVPRRGDHTGVTANTDVHLVWSPALPFFPQIRESGSHLDSWELGGGREALTQLRRLQGFWCSWRRRLSSQVIQDNDYLRVSWPDYHLLLSVLFLG